MYGIQWIAVLWLHLVSVATYNPGSWNCSTEPEVDCISYDISDDSKPPEEQDYFYLENFPLKHSQNHTEQGITVTWTFDFNDTQIDGFSVETVNLWRILLVKDLHRKRFPFQLNLTTRIEDNTVNDDAIQIYPLMTEPKYWDHVTKNIEFYIRKISSRAVKIILSSDTKYQGYEAKRFVDSCDSNLPMDTVMMQSNTVIFSNMTFGNYCFLFTPQEPYPHDPARCSCYRGSTTLRQCYKCGRSILHYAMNDPIDEKAFESSVLPEAVTETSVIPKTVSESVILLQTMSHGESSQMSLEMLLGSLGGSIVVICIIIVAILRRQHIRNFLLRPKFHGRKILVLAIYDSDIHRQTVECFSSCLRTCCRCNVQIISNNVIDKEAKTFQNVEQITDSFDVVIIILSQKLLSLIEELQCSCKENTIYLEIPSTILIKTLLELLQSKTQSRCKIVTLHSSYSSKVQSITNALLASNFHLIDEFISLLLKIHYTGQNLSDVSRQCSNMMKQLQKIDQFRELKCLASSVGLAEMSRGGDKTSKARLESLNVDSGQGSSLSCAGVCASTQIHRSDDDSEELSSCSVWSDSGRKHHDRKSLQHYNVECINGIDIANCKCDVYSLATIGEFSV